MTTPTCRRESSKAPAYSGNKTNEAEHNILNALLVFHSHIIDHTVMKTIEYSTDKRKNRNICARNFILRCIKDWTT